MRRAASSLGSWVATSRSSTTTIEQVPKGTLCSEKRCSTLSGSLTIIRAIAESVDSEMLMATTCASCACKSFTTSSMAPTLFGRKMENCVTSGPSIFEVVCGNSTSMEQDAPPPVQPVETQESMAPGGIFLQIISRSRPEMNRSYSTDMSYGDATDETC